MGADGSSVFLGHNEGPGLRNKWFFGFGGETLYFYVRSSGAAGKLLSKAPFSPESHQWYHLALTRSSGVFRTYINGVQKGSETNAVSIPEARAPLRIGESQGLFMDGMLDEVSIYQRALTTSEVHGVYMAGASGKCQERSSLVQIHGKMNSAGHFELTIEGGLLSSVLIIQSSPDLKSWQNLGQVTRSYDPEIYTDSDATPRARFYRILVSH
jgi:hypothetical protein